MNKNAFGIICTNYESTGFGSLLEKRTLASLPFGGRYRMVDFPLSAMAHAGITTVGLIMPYYYRSLIDHVRSGKAWGLDRKIDGLFTLPGSAYASSASEYKLHIGDLTENHRYLERRPKGAYCVIMATSKIFNIDLKPVLAQHENSGKDVTIVYYTNSAGKKCLADTLILSREVLIDIVSRYKNHPYESLFAAINTYIDKSRINEFFFDGYIADISNISDYVNASRDLLEPKIHRELFNKQRLILTKTQDEAPAFYEEGSYVNNSLVSAGCVIEGSIENCILFRKVHIEKGAIVKNCILMQHSIIKKNARLSNVVLDKYTEISEGVVLSGGMERPIIIPKNDLV